MYAAAIPEFPYRAGVHVNYQEKQAAHQGWPAEDEGPAGGNGRLRRHYRGMMPFVREAGAGPGVVCVHSNASSSAQWRALMDLLAPKFHVFAPDSYGSGKSPEWHSDRVISLRDEVALIEPVLAKAGSPLALVGHSYGAAVALIAALANPGRVRALALDQPTLFSLIEAERPAPNEADGIQNAVARSSVGPGRGRQGRRRAPFHRLLDGQALDSVGAWSGALADGRTAAGRGGRVREARSHGAGDPSRSGKYGDQRISRTYLTVLKFRLRDPFRS